MPKAGLMFMLLGYGAYLRQVEKSGDPDATGFDLLMFAFTGTTIGNVTGIEAEQQRALLDKITLLDNTCTKIMEGAVTPSLPITPFIRIMEDMRMLGETFVKEFE